MKFQTCAYSLSGLGGCQYFSNFVIFLVNKNCKTYLGPLLPPVDRNWQLISPSLGELASQCMYPCSVQAYKQASFVTKFSLSLCFL
jgi:hypothetical protein